MRLRVDAHSPILIRWQLTEQLKHVIEGGDIPGDHALPSIRELADVLGTNPNTVARAIEDLERSGHVEARRDKGVFVAPAPPTRPFRARREDFLKDAVIRAAALEMTPDDAHTLDHPIANAALPNIARIEAGPAEGAALGALVRRGGRHRLFHLGRRAGPGTRGAHGPGDRRRPGAQPAGHSGATGRRPSDDRSAPRPEAAESSFISAGETASGQPCGGAITR